MTKQEAEQIKETLYATPQIWDGVREWVKKAVKYKWVNLKGWYDDDEMVSSIVGYIAYSGYPKKFLKEPKT